MSAKDTTVNIRCSAETKARWMEAAGGPRKLSAWLTELANAASSPDAAEALVAIGAQIKLAQAAVPMRGVEILVPPKAEDQAHRESRPLPAAGGDSGADSSATASRTASSGGAEKCSRWMHHRKGVYCGTCKKVN